METKPLYARINGKKVAGKAHLQPGVNRWIGIFYVGNDLLQGEAEKWNSAVIEYEGLFHCNDENIPGNGKARITHVGKEDDSHHYSINIEGVGTPKLEGKFRSKPQFEYDENLPCK